MKAAMRRPEPVQPSAPEADVAGLELLTRLEDMCADRGLGSLARQLAGLSQLVGADMAAFEEAFAKLPRHPRLVGDSAHHLLDLGGKRLRPLCVALAARVGNGFDQRVLDLAVAVELVHAATLLHDDVVDHSDTRRGTTTARAIYGNAASIFAGDWVLIEALRRVERCAFPGLLRSLFDTVEQMIWAESLQLEGRGRPGLDRRTYFGIVEGKTASVFRWGMRAGAMAGGLDESQGSRLEEYGHHLGVAFQATDDLLDLTGDPAATGKALFTDLREGKMTYPMIVALEREPQLRPLVEEIVASTAPEAESAGEPLEAYALVIEGLRRTGAVEVCLDFAREQSDLAQGRLETLPPGPAVDALATVAGTIVERRL